MPRFTFRRVARPNSNRRDENCHSRKSQDLPMKESAPRKLVATPLRTLSSRAIVEGESEKSLIEPSGENSTKKVYPFYACSLWGWCGLGAGFLI